MPTVYFDGGCSKQVGTTGYIAYREDGSLWFGAGHIVEKVHTNNEAEFKAIE